MNLLSGHCYQIAFNNGYVKSGVVFEESGEWTLFCVEDSYDLHEDFIQWTSMIEPDYIRKLVEQKRMALWEEEYYLDNSVLGNIINE